MMEFVPAAACTHKRNIGAVGLEQPFPPGDVQTRMALGRSDTEHRCCVSGAARCVFLVADMLRVACAPPAYPDAIRAEARSDEGLVCDRGD